jgi:hypothetical protein
MLLIGNQDTVQQLQAGTPSDQIAAGWTNDLSAFDAVRRKYFLYK